MPGAASKHRALFIAAAGLLCAVGPRSSWAQSAPPIPLPDAGDLMFAPPTPGVTGALQPPTSGYSGLHMGPWTIYPTLFSGTAFNDNVYQTSSHRRADLGWRLTPSIYATNNNGINNFAAYAALDSIIYLRNSDADTVTGRVGFQDRWEIQRDLVLKLGADVSRQTDTTISGQTVGGSTIEPLRYWQYQTSASLIKSFNRFFVGAGASFVNSSYDRAYQTNGPSINQSFRDLNYAVFSARGGVYVGPSLYAYTEASENNQDYYNNSAFSSHGYRVVGGLGSDQFSLFKGEIYGGFQQQYYSASVGGVQSGPAFGGHISWFPTEFITVVASADDSYGTSVPSSLAPNVGSPSNTARAGLAFNYAMAVNWSAAANINYANITYTGSNRVDHDYVVGLTLNRKIWENLAGTVSYQFNAVDSNVASASYYQNILSLGVTYKY